MEGSVPHGPDGAAQAPKGGEGGANSEATVPAPLEAGGGNTKPSNGESVAEDNRAGSSQPLTWFEFILQPNLLGTHLSALKAGTLLQPSAVELIVAFMEQVVKGSDDLSTPWQWLDAVKDAKSHKLSACKVLLQKLAAFAALDGGMGLLQVEGEIPARYQPPLLAALAFHAPPEQAAVHEVDLPRWAIRRALAPPTPPAVQPGAAPASKPLATAFFFRSGPAAEAAAVGGGEANLTKLGSAFYHGQPSEVEAHAAAALKSAIATNFSSSSTTGKLPPACLAACKTELGAWTLARGEVAEALEILLSAWDHISQVPAAEMPPWSPPGWWAQPGRSLGKGAQHTKGLGPYLEGFLRAAASMQPENGSSAVSSSSSVQPPPAGAAALACAAWRRGDEAAMVEQLLAEARRRFSGLPGELPEGYIRSIKADAFSQPRSMKCGAACCLALAAADGRGDSPELLPLLGMLQRNPPDELSATQGELVDMMMGALSPAASVDAPASTPHAALCEGMVAFICQSLDSPAVWAAARAAGLMKTAGMKTTSEQPRSPVLLEPTAPHSSSLAGTLLHCLNNSDELQATAAATASTTGACGLISEALQLSAVRVSTLALGGAPPDCQLNQQHSQALQHSIEAMESSRPAKRPKAGKPDGDEDGEVAEDSGSAATCAWMAELDRVRTGTLGQQEAPPIDNLPQGTPPQGILCLVLAALIDTRRWDSLASLHGRFIAGHYPPTIRALAAGGMALGMFLQGCACGNQARYGSSMRDCSASFLKTFTDAGRQRATASGNHMGAATLSMFPQGLLALEPQHNSSMRSIAAGLEEPGLLKPLTAALSVFLLHLTKPSCPQDMLAERWGVFAGHLTEEFPPNQGVSHLGTRAASFAAAEVRAMLRTVLHRLLALQAHSRDLTQQAALAEAQPCTLQLADMAFEHSEHRKALEKFCQVAVKIGTKGLQNASIRRISECLKAMGFPLAAAAVLQDTRPPDIPGAMALLHPSSTTAALAMAKDSAFLECFWEIPLLELLVQRAHSLGAPPADRAAAIRLMQRPALNSHNPPEVRTCAVEALRQRLLTLVVGLVISNHAR